MKLHIMDWILTILEDEMDLYENLYNEHDYNA